jgi:arsenate reductase (glutaredoxin)
LPKVTILHNPRCSKSRAALALLAERGIEPQIIDYLADPPGIEELRNLLRLLGIGPRELMRREESEYRELGLDDAQLADAELVAALHAHPRLIQRPIVIANGKAVIGRPTQAILEIL